MILTIEVRAKSGKANELYQTLQALLPTMRRAKGCVDCRVSPDMRDGELHALSCDWESRAGFEEYIRSGSGSALIGALDLLGESARVRLGDDAKWEGTEALKRIRKEGG
jgi:quinol monooxygenase YgiN